MYDITYSESENGELYEEVQYNDGHKTLTRYSPPGQWIEIKDAPDWVWRVRRTYNDDGGLRKSEDGHASFGSSHLPYSKYHNRSVGIAIDFAVDFARDTAKEALSVDDLISVLRGAVERCAALWEDLESQR